MKHQIFVPYLGFFSFLLPKTRHNTVQDTSRTLSTYQMLHMSINVPGRVITMDLEEKYVNVGRRLIEDSEHGSKVDFMIGPAADALMELKRNGYSNTVII